MGWPVRVIRLASSQKENGLWCGPTGLSLAGRPLVDDDNGFRPKSLRELQATLNDVYGPVSRLDPRDFLPGLNNVARSLNKGNLPLAMISSVLLKLPDIPAFQVTKYSDEEDRDAHGRWTDGGERDVDRLSPLETTPEETPALDPAEAEIAPEVGEGIAARLAPRILGLLGSLAEAASGPLALAAGVLIPTNSSNIHYIDLPGFPGLSCRSDEGIVTISYLDTATDTVKQLYHGFPDEQGFYRDADGYVIGQHVGTGAFFDEEALKDFDAKAGLAPDPAGEPSNDPSPDGNDDDPENCPIPTPENTKGRSKRALAYQSQITGLPEGWDVVLNDVRFDGCDEGTQRMIEAKGLGMEWMLNWPRDKLENSKFYQRMIRQAGRQNEASAGRGDDYYFASKRMADFFSEEFAKEGYSNITVYHVESIIKKITKWLNQIFSRVDFATSKENCGFHREVRR